MNASDFTLRGMWDVSVPYSLGVKLLPLIMSMLPISEEIQVKECTEKQHEKSHYRNTEHISVECFIWSNPTGQSLPP